MPLYLCGPATSLSLGIGDTNFRSTVRLVPLIEPWQNWSVERFTAVIHEDPEGGFWAEVPALPGCYSQGETMDDLLVNVREAIAGVLEVMAQQGKRPETNIQILDVAV